MLTTMHRAIVVLLPLGLLPSGCSSSSYLVSVEHLDQAKSHLPHTVAVRGMGLDDPTHPLRYLRYSRVSVEEGGPTRGTMRVTVPGNRLRLAGVIIFGAIGVPLLGIGLATIGGTFGSCVTTDSCSAGVYALGFPIAGAGLAVSLIGAGLWIGSIRVPSDVVKSGDPGMTYLPPEDEKPKASPSPSRPPSSPPPSDSDSY